MARTYVSPTIHTVLIVVALILAVLAAFSVAVPPVTALAVAVILICIAMLT